MNTQKARLVAGLVLAGAFAAAGADAATKKGAKLAQQPSGSQTTPSQATPDDQYNQNTPGATGTGSGSASDSMGGAGGSTGFGSEATGETGTTTTPGETGTTPGGTMGTPTPGATTAPGGTGSATGPDASGTGTNTGATGSDATTGDSTMDRSATNGSDQNGGGWRPGWLQDRQTTSSVRKAIMGDETMAAGVSDLKVSTKRGKVTLRGTVRTQQEKDAIAAKAHAVVGADNVINEITVAP